MRRGRRKKLYTDERGIPLRGPHEEAEIQRKAETRENLAFSEDTSLEKKSTAEGNPKKIGMGLNRRKWV